jgi:H+-transporting ATPase
MSENQDKKEPIEVQAVKQEESSMQEKMPEEHVEINEELDAELEKMLMTSPSEGLTDAQVEERLLQFGRNGIHFPFPYTLLEIPEHKTNPYLKFLSYFTGSISFLLEIAAIIAVVLKNYIDFGILIFVLIANACIGFFEEAKAENALDALKNTLALKSRCWRNRELVEVDSSLLVPGDIIAVRLGDIVPADCRYVSILNFIL